jgi:hypothetical protein
LQRTAGSTIFAGLTPSTDYTCSDTGMQLLQHATSFMAISQLLFMALFYLAYYRHQLLGKLMALYAVCLMGFILAVLPEFDNGPRVRSMSPSAS